MGVQGFNDLLRHVGHKIECVRYGKGGVSWNVAVECITCGEVLMDFDNPNQQKPTP